jgi:hypothetical protein
VVAIWVLAVPGEAVGAVPVMGCENVSLVPSQLTVPGGD